MTSSTKSEWFIPAGWAINLAWVEWILMRERTKDFHLALTSAQQPGHSNTGGPPWP